MLVGGAAVGGGAAYAAGHTGEGPSDEPITAEDVVEGADAAQTYQPTTESQAAAATTEQTVQTEQPATQHVDTPEEETPEVTWDDRTVVYDENGNVEVSVESGTVEGKTFALYDLDGDNHADYLAVDMDGNGHFDDNEVVKYEVSDHVHMGHDVAHTHEIYGATGWNAETGEVAQNDNTIHNDFEDEKTGENYYGDYAENNPDYNPHADMNDYGSQQAGMHDVAQNDDHYEEYDGHEETYDGLADDTHDYAQTDDTHDYAQADDIHDDYSDQPDDIHDDYASNDYDHDDADMSGDEYMG